MYANIVNNTIEMTKSEAKAAGKLNSKAFTELKELRAVYPNARIVIKTASKVKDNLKGLNVPFMVKYINTHDDDKGTIMGCFNALRGCNEDGSKDNTAEPLTYGELKKWFIEQYPEVVDMDRTTLILAAHKAAA